MSSTIAVETYKAAFNLWAQVNPRLNDRQRKIVDEAMRSITVTGEHPTANLCKHMYNWANQQDPEHEDDDLRGLQLQIEKSCCLNRMIYGGEALRTKKCPIHKGRWSGCVPEPCKYCSFGCDVTGWVRHDRTVPEPADPGAGI